MISRKFAALAATTTLALAFGATPAFGQAFYLQEQSVRGAGRAFSGEAADTGSQSLWWNPAAIGGETRASGALGVSLILPHGKVVDTGTRIVRPGQLAASVGGDPVASNPINKGALPSGSIAVPLNDRVALGLAISSPFSFTTDYDADSWTRYSADKTSLRTIDVQPSIGVAVTDNLRIGGALNIEYAKATLSNALPNLSPLLADGSQRLKGDGWDFGWSAGLQLHNERATLGLAYKSSVRHKLTGDLRVSGLVGPLAGSNVSLSDISATFRTPDQIIVAGRYKATDQLTLNAQFVRFGWKKFDDIALGAPVNQALPQNYRNSWSLAGGVDYAVSPELTLRAGVQRALTPTRDGQRDARVPDSNRWNFGLGGSYAVTKAITLDAAANYVDFAKASIDRPTAAYVGTPAQTVILTSGQLEKARAVVLSFGGAVHF
ncbi:OmpP1/FadL family transporter [Sphingomonas astaxanthinifaciens]|uniref:Long-chain fatty acid transporter n=1 Tax=Sphingomonas astaxanthinifaciens DSM 22298 TaxID=1123267 RepID=A0ABQ5Z3A8_9SPHN|nr:porin [Sphingomonas astaxanthinifaciens]GLR46506.1 long-chain fatty acid transporter [Sphingomonas astaxanthinifaciens DSM 22298]